MLSLIRKKGHTPAVPHLLTLCLLLLTAVAAKPQATDAKPAPDLIIFTNGNELSGTVVRGVGDSIVFKSDMVGEITIPLAKIKEIRTSGSYAVLRKDTPVTKQGVQPGTIEYGDNAINVSRPTVPVETIPVKDLAFIIDAPTYEKELHSSPGFFHGWTGDITAGATFVQSTQNGSTFTAGISLLRAIPTVTYLPRRNRTSFNLLETYGKFTQPVIPQTTPPSPDTVVKTNIFHTDAERDQYLSPRFYALGIVAFDHNYSQGLNLQELFGGGFGWTVISTPVQVFDIKGDIHYAKQYFQDSTYNQDLIGATIGENYLRNLPMKIVFTEFANYLPAFNNSKAYSANFGAGIILPVYHRFSASFSTTDNYLNNPPLGFKHNSYQFVTGLSYSLH
jgi:hypothetical protein